MAADAADYGRIGPGEQTKKPEPDEMGTAGEPGGGVDDPTYIPTDPYVEGEKKDDGLPTYSDVKPD